MHNLVAKPVITIDSCYHDGSDCDFHKMQYLAEPAIFIFAGALRTGGVQLEGHRQILLPFLFHYQDSK